MDLMSISRGSGTQGFPNKGILEYPDKRGEKRITKLCVIFFASHSEPRYGPYLANLSLRKRSNVSV